MTVRPASGSLPDTAAPSVTLTVSPSAAAATAAAAAGQAQQLLLRVLAKVYYCQQNDVCLFEQVSKLEDWEAGGWVGCVGKEIRTWPFQVLACWCAMVGKRWARRR